MSPVQLVVYSDYLIPETGRCLVGLADLFQYRAAVDEAARAAS
jgi:hypothetical protein